MNWSTQEAVVFRVRHCGCQGKPKDPVAARAGIVPGSPEDPCSD
jgi:hypothetical protein